MTEPPTVEGPRTSTLVAVVIGFLLGVVGVLVVVLDLSWTQVATVLLPMLVVAAVSGAAFLWARRRGDL